MPHTHKIETRLGNYCARSLPRPHACQVQLPQGSPPGSISLIVETVSAVLCNRGFEAQDLSVEVRSGAELSNSFLSLDSICPSSGFSPHSFLLSLNLMSSGTSQMEPDRGENSGRIRKLGSEFSWEFWQIDLLKEYSPRGEGQDRGRGLRNTKYYV